MIYVAMGIRMVMVMRSKIVLIRVPMVIVYLSGTSPGFSLSALFLAGGLSGVGVDFHAGVNFAFWAFSEVRIDG